MVTKITVFFHKVWSRQAWPLSLASSALLLHLIDARSYLAFDRVAIAQGEYWRMVTGHLVHLGTGHLLENLAGVVLVMVLCGDQLSPRHWAVVTLVTAIATSVALYLFMPSLAWYMGLSGLLYGMLVAGLIVALRRQKSDVATMTIFALVAVKIGWEQVGGPLPGSVWLTGGDVIINAHLYGAVSGLLVSLLWPSRLLAGEPWH